MLAQNELLSLLICPDCKSQLRSLSKCDACGIVFQISRTGTPSLFPQKAVRTVSFEFTPDRSSVGSAFKQSFSYPPRRGADAVLPYHLDLAHYDILQGAAPSSFILEIGCGGGQMRKFIQNRGHQYIGTDLST